MLDKLQRFQLYKNLNPNELSIQQFQMLEHEIKHLRHGLVSDEYVDFQLWSSQLPSRQESLAEFISEKLSKNKGAKILEVGGGRTGRLSRFLAEKGFQMTCVDPQLIMTDSCDIKYIKEKFDYENFDISMYDYVIAQEPCEAAEHVVRACINQNKPFMMILCGVPHKLISGQMPKDINEWYDYLVNIASDKIKLCYIELDPFLKTPMLKSNEF